MQSEIIESMNQKVEVFLTCQANYTDLLVRCLAEKDGMYDLIGATEVAKGNPNPSFAKSFILDYFFNQKQRLRFEVLSYSDPSRPELIGEVLTSLNELVGAKNQTSMLGIINRLQERTGKLVIQCEQVQECNDQLKLQFGADNLPKTTSILPFFMPSFTFSFLGYTSSFLRLSRSREDGTWVTVHQTQIAEKTQSPIWEEFTISVQKLANGDYYRPIKLECVTDTGNGHVVMGEVVFNLQDIVQDKKREFKLKPDVGVIRINKCELINKFTFLDYVRGGLQLAVACAIDFTGSNGIPTAPDSLHATKIDGTLNEYQRAITGVCDILLAYDSDKLVPVYGFGGKPKFPNYYTGQTSHCFPCNGIASRPDVYGLEGIMECYKYALKNVELAGPTLFAPLITETMKIAEENKQKGSQVYTILLILTDGEIHDMENTINALIKSAYLPLSIIIVGIGGGDFGKMEILDGDQGLYNSNGVKAERDLVQFVPFRKFEGNQEILAKEVLEEIPRQLVEYMTSIGQKPNPPIKIDANVMYQQEMKPEVSTTYPNFGPTISDSRYQQYGYPPQVMGIGYNVVESQLQKPGVNVPYNSNIQMSQQQPTNIPDSYKVFIQDQIPLTNSSVKLNSFSNFTGSGKF